jgi:hypothetical protein
MSLLIEDPRGLLNIESPDTREGESLVLREFLEDGLEMSQAQTLPLAETPQEREPVTWASQGLELQSSQYPAFIPLSPSPKHASCQAYRSPSHA